MRSRVMRTCGACAGVVLGVIAVALAFGPMPGRAQSETETRVRIGSFGIDRTEVTIRAFRAFARERGFKTAAEKAGGGFEYDGGWQRRRGWSVYRPFGAKPVSDLEPAVHVSWSEARAYCAWMGGRLPTAAEWKLAAYTETRTNPGDGFVKGKTYRYPVGDTPDGMNTDGEPWPRHAPVGVTKRGVNGLYDMGGNVWEWLADRQGAEALTAGGSWWYGPDKTTAQGLQYKPADFYAVYVGFRCAYDFR